MAASTVLVWRPKVGNAWAEVNQYLTTSADRFAGLKNPTRPMSTILHLPNTAVIDGKDTFTLAQGTCPNNTYRPSVKDLDIVQYVQDYDV